LLAHGQDTDDQAQCLSGANAADVVLACGRALEHVAAENSAALHVARGQAYGQLRQYVSAERDFTAALAAAPTSAAAHYGRGILYTQTDRWEAALDEFSAVLNAHPEDPDARFQRAFVYARLGKIDPAIDDLSVLLKAHPDDAEAFNDRAGLFLKKGEYQKALGDYTAAIAHVRDYNEALYNRGRAYWLLGKQAEARTDLQAVLRLRPHNPYAALRLALCGDASALADARAQLASGQWPGPLLDLYQNRAQAADVLAQAARLGRDGPAALTEANFYIGAQLRMRGDKAAAQPYFSAARAGASSIIESIDAALLAGK
jgi:lipoprotein NlpI